MRSRRLRWIGALPLLFALSGCGDPANPFDIPPMVAGTVRLDASLTDAGDQSLGARVSITESGVRVWLMEGHRLVDSTTTTNGVYVLKMVRGHSYRVVVGLPASPLDSTAVITANTFRAQYPDTLRLRRRGNLTSSPNPFPFAVRLEFSFAADTRADLEVYDLAARRVRVLASRTFVAGLHAFTWDGRDDAGTAVSEGMYWVLLRTPDETRAELLLKQP